MDHAALARRRWRSAGLAGPLDAAEPADVVRWFGAVQAQDYHPACWGLAQRLPGAVTDGDVQAAFAAGTILRTHVLRPTWHFVTPDDIGWLLELTAPRVHALNAYYYRQNDLDEPLLRRAADLIADAVADGVHLTRPELAATLQRHGIVAERFRLSYLVMYAELERVVCSGPPRGKQHTYALLAERAPRTRRLDRDEALAELVRRYLTGHGPATAKDLSWWSSLTLADVATGLAAAGDALERVDVDGVAFWSVPGAADPGVADAGSAGFVAEAVAGVRLLQPYDEYLVGYSESSFLPDLSGVAAATPETAGIPNGILMLGTQVAGRWKRTIRAREVAIEAAAYEPFRGAVAAGLQPAADAHGAFLGRTASATVTTLGPGP